MHTKFERLLSKSLTTLEVLSYYLVVHTGPELCISTIYHAWDTPFWSGTLDIESVVKSPSTGIYIEFCCTHILLYTTASSEWLVCCLLPQSLLWLQWKICFQDLVVVNLIEILQVGCLKTSERLLLYKAAKRGPFEMIYWASFVKLDRPADFNFFGS